MKYRKLVTEMIKNSIKERKNRKLKENYTIDDFEDASDVYSKFGSKFPYASDAVAKFIFADKTGDNSIVKAIRGTYGGSLDEYELSKYMLNYENSWYEDMETIEDDISNMQLDDGEILKNVY